MDDRAIQAVVAEIRPLLQGRAPGKIFQLAKLSFVFDFGLRDHRYLLINVDPALPRIYLIKRRIRDLKRDSIASTGFSLLLHKELADTRVQSINKDDKDRVVRFRFEGKDDLGAVKERILIAQLTGRSANLFLLDARGQVIQPARTSRQPTQRIGDQYSIPQSASHRRSAESDSIGSLRNYDSPSEAADAYYSELLALKALDERISNARTELRKKIDRQKKLLRRLRHDLESHADAEKQKRIGDLLLANLSTAKRTGTRLKLIDYFSPDQLVIEIEVDEKTSLSQEAEKRFSSYSRSKRALKQIQSRIETAKTDLEVLESKREAFEKAIANGDTRTLEQFLTPDNKEHPRKPRSVDEKQIPGTRRYVSSDGYQILVGRAARDNDHLTFRVAKAHDLWLHAADYPGSHVVVRNSTRKEIPHRTIIEAAQLAAHFSQAGKDPKVDVHYTQRKYLSKPKGGATGRVRMSRFKNITVRPDANAKRL